MAYYNNIPQYFQSAAPIPFNNQQPNGVIWVLGEQAARSYPVGPNQNIALFDKDNPVFYIKSVDSAGVPTFKVFDYTERQNDISKEDPNQETLFITKAEFEDFKNEIRSEINKNSSYKPQYKKKEN